MRPHAGEPIALCGELHATQSREIALTGIVQHRPSRRAHHRTFDPGTCHQIGVIFRVVPTMGHHPHIGTVGVPGGMEFFRDERNEFLVLDRHIPFAVVQVHVHQGPGEAVVAADPCGQLRRRGEYVIATTIGRIRHDQCALAGTEAPEKSASVGHRLVIAIVDRFAVGVEEQLAVLIGNACHSFIGLHGAAGKRGRCGPGHVQPGTEAEEPVAVLRLGEQLHGRQKERDHDRSSHGHFHDGRSARNAALAGTERERRGRNSDQRMK